MILISVLLVALVSKWWLLFTTFIGVNLIQSAFTSLSRGISNPSAV
jgi:hypothetical protein